MQEQSGADTDEGGNGTGVREARGARGRGGKGRGGWARAVADATVLAKYVVLVARAKAATQEAARRAAVWFLRWRQEKQACVRAGGRVGGSAAGETGPERTDGADKVSARVGATATRNFCQVLGAETAVGQGKRPSAGRQVSGRAGDQWNARKDGSAHCGGGRKHLFIGLNVVAALQRDECLGRSWRGVWGDG